MGAAAASEALSVLSRAAEQQIQNQLQAVAVATGAMDVDGAEVRPLPTFVGFTIVVVLFL